MIKKYFKSESERDLWIKLNAERILIYQNLCNKAKNKPPTTDLGCVDEQYSPMYISKNQLEFDERFDRGLRFSFEDLLLLNDKILLNKTINKAIDDTLKYFPDFKI